MQSLTKYLCLFDYLRIPRTVLCLYKEYVTDLSTTQTWFLEAVQVFLCENAVLSSIFFGWVFCSCWGDFMTPCLLLCFIKHFYCDIELIFNLFVCILRRWYKPTTKGPKSSLGWNVVESVSSHVVLNKSDHFSLHIAWKSSTVYFYLIHGCLFIWIWKKFLEYIFRFSSKQL